MSYTKVGAVDLCTSCPNMSMITALVYAHRICTVDFRIVIRCEIYVSELSGVMEALGLPITFSRNAFIYVHRARQCMVMIRT